MLIVVSPAKSLDMETAAPYKAEQLPALNKHTIQLVDRLKELSPKDISELMKVSDKIAELNFERNHNWDKNYPDEKSKSALFAFTGDVYRGLDALSLSDKAVKKAQESFRMLSGLYGVLKPLDHFQAYRLEMGTKLENTRGKDLYQFWGDLITEELNKDIETYGHKYLINLASNEYFKSVNKKALNAEIITPVFKDEKNGKYKIIAFYAKYARGLMSRFILENDVKSPDDLKAFDLDGYVYNEALSTKKNEIVFTRAEDAAK